MSGWVCPAATSATPTSLGTTKSEPKPPLIFIGGLGIGKLPYLPFLHKLHNRTKLPMVIVDMPHVNLSISNFLHSTGNVPAIDAVVHALENIAKVPELNGSKSYCWVAHSYGSIYVSWILRERPQLAKVMIL